MRIWKVTARRSCATALGLVMAASASAAWAQQAATGPAVEDISNVEDIVVTARLRSESLQDVPAAISAYSEEALQKAGIQNLESLAAATPGLSFQSIGGTYQAPVIRGLAQIDQTSPIGNVGVFVDGLYLNNRSGLEFSFLDLARVEVVKGPQSALYGRNTFSGAINYVTKQPTIGYLSGSAAAEVGTYGRQSLQGSISIPIGDVAAVRVWGGAGKFDGTIENVRDGGNLGGYEKRANYGASVLYEPTDRLSLKLFHMRTDTHEDQAPFAFIATADNNCGSQAVGPLGPRNTLYCGSAPYPQSVDLNTTVATGLAGFSTLSYAQASYDLGFATLSGTVGYNYAKFSQNNDGTGNANAINVPLRAGSPYSQQGFSQTVGNASDETSVDLKLISPADGRLRWIGGLYYFDSNISDGLLSFNTLLGDINSRILSFSRGGDMNIEGLAVYGSAEYDITDRLTLSLEGRYSKEDQKYQGLASVSSAVGNAEYKYFTPKGVLSFDLNDDTLVYGSVAKGYKIGGFNSNAAGLPQFHYDPETNWTYELGLKGSVFDKRLIYATSLFYIDWSNIQVQGAIPSSTLAVVQNAKGATSYGVEWESTYYFTPNVFLRGSFALLDPTYKDGTLDAEVAAPCGEIPGSTVINPGCSTDVGGNQLARTTKAQFAVSGGWTVPELVGDFDGFARFDYSFQKSKHSTSLNQDEQGDIELMNIQIGLENGPITIAAWARNLFDTEYLARITTTPSTNDGAPLTGVTQSRVYPGDRRTVGVRIAYSF